jgi:RNA polymerase sigma factor (sigma-70 family)
MPTSTPPRSGGTDPADARLTPLFQAASEAEITRAIEELLGGELSAVTRDVVRRELNHSPAGAAYIEDVLADVRLRLMRKLGRLRDEPDAPIQNLLAYASVVAENACHAFLRLQYPDRTRFRNRVRYAVAHHPSTSLVRDAGIWRCQTRQVRRAPESGAAQQLLDSPARWLADRRIDPAQPLPALLAAVLDQCDRPVELDRLVDALAAALGIADSQPLGGAADRAPAREVVDPAPTVSDVLEQRQALLRVWTEIVELPVRQRAALLLNLRDPEGGAVLHMLPGTGVVSPAGIAAALEIDEHVLDTLWDRLPLDDLSIAAQLGLTRQQVINLRKSARARLARRLRGAS